MNLGYGLSIVLFGGLIGLVAIGRFVFKINDVLAFWAAYVLTRPLVAAIGDFLSQDKSAGGRGLGTVGTSYLFLAAILGVVVYLSITRRDQTPAVELEAA